MGVGDQDIIDDNDRAFYVYINCRDSDLNNMGEEDFRRAIERGLSVRYPNIFISDIEVREQL